MSERAAGQESPASPDAFVPLSRGRQDTGPTHAPPQIPDHELLCPIGRGAYGQVWLARNVVGTRRAVKVVYRHDFGDEHPFDREFKGIQKFEPISRSHPGVVNVLQIGRNEAEGYFYYVMELADAAEPRSGDSSSAGSHRSSTSSVPTPLTTDDCLLTTGYLPRTLRHDLKLRGRLRFDECLQFGLSLTSALEHLHQHGLVHRDVKPSNIIFVNGQPKLADIGLVAGVDEARSFVGTEGFIPPEGPGKPQADLYSLGIVLYVMSTGKRHDAFPEPLTDLAADPNHSRWLELNAIIHKACHTDPHKRYQSAGEMHADMLRLRAGKSVRRQQRWTLATKLGRQVVPIAAGLVAFVAMAVALWPRAAPLPSVVTSGPQPVFVLPFRSPPGDIASEELAGRLTDALIDSLGLILGPGKVGTRKSGWLLKNQEEARRLAFEQQNARQALEGNVTVVSNRVEVRLSSRCTPTNLPMWTASFSGTTNDIIALEWGLLNGLCQRLAVAIPERARAPISQLLSNNLAALELCREGWRFQESFSMPRLTSAKAAFLRATELDRNYVGAHYGALWVNRVSYDRSYRDVWPDVRSRAQVILQIDDSHWNTRYYLAWARINHDYDWAGGMRELEAVLREGSADPGEWAIYYRTIGRLKEARLSQDKDDALERPRGVLLWHSGAGKYLEGRYEDAVRISKKIQQAEPESHIGFMIEAWGRIGQRDFPTALDAVRRGLNLQERQDLRGLLGYVYARMSETNKANEVLAQLNQLAYTQPYWVARIHAALGESNQALTWLEQAYADRSELLVQADIGMGALRMDEAWENVRSEPRFKELLRKTGLDTWPK